MTTDEFLTLFALQICWYFTDTWEQFRISGFIDVIDGSNPEPVKLQLRERAWFGSSVKSRLQYLGPCPGLPIPDDDLIKDAHLDPSAGPVDAFCLLVLDPEKVDYLNLKSNQRLMFTRNQKGDGTNSWMAEKISP
jgi:pyridoxamine 5'-phosphate oxidase